MCVFVCVCVVYPIPKTKLSGLKICPKGPDRTESIVPGSRSTKMALGTYFPPAIQSHVLKMVKYRPFESKDRHIQ